MLNSTKPYYQYQLLLKQNVLSKQHIINSNIYKFICNLGYKLNENLWITNIQSMAMSKNPNMLRVRNDKFLNKSKQGEDACLISGIRLNNKELFLVYFGKSFIGYNKSIKSSNSFITFTFEQLNKMSECKDQIQTKNVKKGAKYLFYSSTDFDENMFENYLNMLQNIELHGYDAKDSKYDPSIPSENRKIIEDRYESICAIAFENPSDCELASQISKNSKFFLSKNYDIHHFIPKEYFKQYFDGLLDWKNVIHNTLNLVPLCRYCHKNIHASDKTLVKKTFEYVIQAYKKANVYLDFLNFLKENTSLKNISELLNFYLN